MQKKFNFVLSFILSLGLIVLSHAVSANELDTLKEELRNEYKQNLENYKALEDKSSYEAKDMRQALVNMGIEAKKIRDLMKDIKSQTDEGEIAELQEQLKGHVDVFRQDHAQFKDTYASHTAPQKAEPEAEPALNVAEEMEAEVELEEEPSEEMDRELAEESTEPTYDEKIVISENMTAEEEEEALESELE